MHSEEQVIYKVGSWKGVFFFSLPALAPIFLLVIIKYFTIGFIGALLMFVSLWIFVLVGSYMYIFFYERRKPFLIIRKDMIFCNLRGQWIHVKPSELNINHKFKFIDIVLSEKKMGGYLDKDVLMKIEGIVKDEK